MSRQAAIAAALGVVCALVLTGCGTSPPTQFISLNTQPPATRPPAGETGQLVPVGLGHIRLPPDLDRLALVRRTGSNRLDVNGIVQWGGPLDELVHRTLAFDLASRLPPGAFVLPGQPMPSSADSHLLLVTFQTFSAGPDNKVTLQAHWTLADTKTSHTLVAKETNIEVQAGSSRGNDIAAAMSKALGRLADQMAEAVLKQGQG